MDWANLTARDRFILVSLSMLVLTVGLYIGLLRPQLVTLQQLRTQIAETETALQQAERTAAALPALRGEVRRLEWEATSMYRVVPAEHSLNELLVQINHLAQESGTRLLRLRPALGAEQTIGRTKLATIKLDIEVEGEYEALTDFLVRLRHVGRLVAAEAVHIMSDELDPPMLTVRIEGSVYHFR